MITGHAHWLRTPAQCEPITQPAARMIAKLPPAQRQHLVSLMDPAALLIGIGRVAGPSLQVEMEAMKGRKAGVIVQRGTVPRETGQPTGAPHDPGKVADMSGTVIPGVT